MTPVPAVGVVCFRGDEVLLIRRGRPPRQGQWSLPGGRIEPGERAVDAALRELREETGVASVELLGRTDDWILYDFPPEALNNAKAWRGFKGQKQRWFAFRFLGDEAEIDLTADKDVEFDAWRWGDLSEACDLIVPFKRPAYERVVAAFAHLARA